MSNRRGILGRLRALLGRRGADDEHVAEVAFHLEMAAQRHEARGVAPDEARRRARLEFGALPDAREAAREARRGAWLDDAWRDVRHAARHLRATPAFTAAAVLTLALAMGCGVAMFSVVDHVLLRALPFADAQRLVVVWETDRRSGTTREPASLPDFLDMRQRMRTLASLDAMVGAVGTLALPARDPQRVSAVAVTDGLLPTLGVTPLRGRTFSPAEAAPGGARVALISASLWRTALGGADSVVGATIRLDDVATQVIGVLPDEADLGIDQVHERAAYHATYEAAGAVDVWLPLQASPRELPRDTHPLLLVGRLAAGATPAQAGDELARIAAELELSYPANTGRGAFVEPFRDVVFGPVRPLLRLLAVAVVLLVVVATVNVANLLLARGAARAREVALRGALGATPRRLARQFSVEAAVLVGIGALAGIVVAGFALAALRALAPGDVPRLAEATLDGRALAAAMVIAGVIGAVFSLVPAITAFHPDPMAVLKGEAGTTTMSPGGRRLRHALVTAQLALCVALAVCAGLVARSFNAILGVDPGYSAASVAKAQYELPATRYPRNFARFPNFTEITQFSERVIDAARAIPGVEAAAIAAAHPLDEGFTNSWRVVGREAEGRDWPEISVRIVTPGYPEVMGLAVRSGRSFGSGDGSGAPAVALINETAARRFFAGSEPIGQEISFWGINRRIVGVVADERIHGVDRVAPPATYIPLSQAPPSSGVLLVRTTRPPDTVLGELRGAIAGVDPQLAVFGLEPFVDTLRGSVGQRRFAMLLMTAFAALTLLLALVGVQGMVAYLAAQRARELGIRQALGASRGSSVRLVVHGTAVLACAGVALGVVGAAAGSGLLARLLFGVSRFDPVTFIGVPSVVLLVSLGAAWWPAWRVARGAPLVAIRSG